MQKKQMSERISMPITEIKKLMPCSTSVYKMGVSKVSQ